MRKRDGAPKVLAACGSEIARDLRASIARKRAPTKAAPLIALFASTYQSYKLPSAGVARASLRILAIAHKNG